MRKTFSVLVLVALAGALGWLALERYLERDAERQAQLFVQLLEDIVPEADIAADYESVDYSLRMDRTVIHQPSLIWGQSADEQMQAERIVLHEFAVTPDDNIMTSLRVDVVGMVMPGLVQALRTSPVAMEDMVANAHLDYDCDPAAQTIALNKAEIHVPGLGRFGLDTKMGNVHSDLMTSNSAPTDENQALVMFQNVYWQALGLHYSDEGLALTWLETDAEESGMSWDEYTADMRAGINAFLAERPFLAGLLAPEAVERLGSATARRLSLRFDAREQGAQMSEFLILAALAEQEGGEAQLWQWLDERYQVSMSVQ